MLAVVVSIIVIVLAEMAVMAAVIATLGVVRLAVMGIVATIVGATSATRPGQVPSGSQQPRNVQAGGKPVAK